MSKFDRQVKDLLDRAMEQPGVAAAMEAYQVHQPALTVFAQAQNAVAARWVVSTTSSTRSQQ